LSFISLLSPANFASQPAARIAALLPQDFESLSKAQLGAMTAEQIGAIESVDMAALNKSQIAAFSPQALARGLPTYLANNHLAAPPTDVTSGLTKAQIGQFKASLVNVILSQMIPAQIGAINPTVIRNIDNGVLRSLSGIQLNALQALQIAQLSPDQLSHLKPEQVGTLSAAWLNKLTEPQIQSFAALSLTLTQLKGLDTVHDTALSGRVATLNTQGPLLAIATPIAKELNLQEGQVVQAAWRLTAGQPELILKGWVINVPPANLGQMAPTLWLKVVQTPQGGWALQPTTAPPATGAPATPATPAVQVTPAVKVTPAVPATPATPATPAVQVTPAAQVTQAVPAAPAAPAMQVTLAVPATPDVAPLTLSSKATVYQVAGAPTAVMPAVYSRTANLLFRPPGTSDVSQLFRPGTLDTLLHNLARPDLQSQWRSMQLSMAQLRPQAIANALASAVGAEVWLARGMATSPSDPKQFLRRVIQAMQNADIGAVGRPQRNASDTHSEPLTPLDKSTDASPKSVTLAQIQHAVEELESTQVQAVQAQAQGDVLFRMTLPFVDANPVELVFRKEPRGQGQLPLLTVNVHSRSDIFGPLWLKTQIEGSQYIDLTMWAEKGDVASAARLRASELGSQLQGAGLNMRSFKIVHGARPESPADFVPMGRGLVLDMSA